MCIYKSSKSLSTRVWMAPCANIVRGYIEIAINSKYTIIIKGGTYTKFLFKGHNTFVTILI